jgi:Holliday junction resolvasome RuvABC DNA-binding subunit
LLPRFDISLPTSDEALADWSRDHGCEVRVTQDSRYANALLRRLSSEEALDALANPNAPAVLRELSPKSRKKLAQRISAELKGQGKTVDANELADARKRSERIVRTSSELQT